MQTDTSQYLNFFDLMGVPLLAVRADSKRPRGSWDNVSLEDAQEIQRSGEYGLAIKLGGSGGLIDIEGDGPGAEARWNQLTAGIPADQLNTCSWRSTKGMHRAFSLSPETRAIIGTGNPKLGDLEVRLGNPEKFTHYSIIPCCGGREWVGPPTIAPLPKLVAERIQAEVFQFQKHVTASAADVPASNPDAPGSIYNERADWREILEAADWTYVRSRQDGVDDWRRPGHTNQECSATVGFTPDKLFVFTTTGLKEQGHVSYDKFAFYAWTYHGGDYSAAAKDLANQGYRRDVSAADLFDDLDLEDTVEESGDEMNIPTELLLFPGFVENFAKFHAERSHRYDLRAGAAAGIMLQSWMMGQKACLGDGTRPNLFAMYLAPSGFGKTAAVDTMKRVLDSSGNGDQLHTQFKSWQAMEEILEATPNMIIVREEVQDFLAALDDGRNPSKTEFASYLKEMATASKSTYRCRGARKADGGAGAMVDQPHVAVLMTGITKETWAAFSPKLLQDGTLGRFWIIETDILPEDNMSLKEDPKLLEACRLHSIQWRLMDVEREAAPEAPEPGVLTQGRIIPLTIDRHPGSAKLADDFRKECRENIQRCANEESVGGAAWSRAHEMMCRFELVIAGSANAVMCHVSMAMTERAITLVRLSLKQKVYRMENQGSLDAGFHQACSKLLAYLNRHDVKGKTKVARRDAYRACSFTAIEMNQIICHLTERREIVTDGAINPDGTRINIRGKFICLYKNRKELERKQADSDIV